MNDLEAYLALINGKILIVDSKDSIVEAVALSARAVVLPYNWRELRP
jgi:hypothetical protein